MVRSKQAIPQASRAEIHDELPMWIISGTARPLPYLQGEKFKARSQSAQPVARATRLAGIFAPPARKPIESCGSAAIWRRFSGTPRGAAPGADLEMTEMTD